MKAFFVGKPKSFSILLGAAGKRFDEVIIVEDVSLGRSEVDSNKYFASRKILVDSNFRCNEFLIENYEEGDYLFSFDNFLVFNPYVCEIFLGKSYNFHPSPLPFYAGINSISWGLLNNEEWWGYTVHRIAPKVDGGEIVFQEVFSLSKDSTQCSIMQYCLLGGLKVMLSVVAGKSFKKSEHIEDYEIRKEVYYRGFSDRPSPNDIALSNKLYEDIRPLSQAKKWQW